MPQPEEPPGTLCGELKKLGLSLQPAHPILNGQIISWLDSGQELEKGGNKMPPCPSSRCWACRTSSVRNGMQQWMPTILKANKRSARLRSSSSWDIVLVSEVLRGLTNAMFLPFLI